jgi:ubiquinol-cytochrome c reductase cytochrome b subunit
MAAMVQINPIWAYGPYDPSPVTAGSQPDWYMGFADGALRLLPGWLEFTAFGFTLSLNIALGALVLLPVVYLLLGIYPFVERWVTRDDREHHLLDRPRNAPVRTGIGMAAITAYSVLLFASGNDIMAIKLDMSINDLTWFFRIGFFVLPIVMFWVTKRICLSLQRRDRDTVLHGRETGTIVRTPDGKFFERHETSPELTPEQWILVQHEPVAPFQVEAGVDENGVERKAHRKDHRRARLSRFYFGDAVNPVTPAELAAAQHHGAEHEAIEPSASGGARPIEADAADKRAEVESGEPAGRH